MNPITHGLIGWGFAQAAEIDRRDRFLVFAAGLVADLDGLTVVRPDLYRLYHHTLFHNAPTALAVTAIVLCAARRRLVTALLAGLAFHVHLACDYVGSAGPDGVPWSLPYLYPFVENASWYWNPYQWRLDAWPNFAVTGVFLALAIFVAVRFDRTFLEFLSPALDRRICETIRARLRASPPGPPAARERALLGAVLALAVAALLAGVIRGALAAG